MKNWNYAVWAVMLSEVIAFGDFSNFLIWITASFLAILMVIRYGVRNAQWFFDGLERFDQSNPLPPKTTTIVLILFTVVAIITPYTTGMINVPLYLFVGSLWLLR